MAKEGKHQFDSGRARSVRHRDRAQLHFDDMLIDEFFADQLPEDQPVDSVPVRFGAQQLADFLDDSTIAAALVRGETFEADEQAKPLTVAKFFDDAGFDLGDEGELPAAEPACVPLPSAPPVDRSITRRAAAATPSTVRGEFTLRGVAQGFFIGVAATLAIVFLLRLAF